MPSNFQEEPDKKDRKVLGKMNTFWASEVRKPLDKTISGNMNIFL